MSRIGRKPIAIPAGVKVAVDGRAVSVTGPKGSLMRDIPVPISVVVDGEQVKVTRPSDSKTNRSLHGLCRTLVANMVEGVSVGFRKNLEINGVGYRAAKAGNKLTLALGYSHPIAFKADEGITFKIDSPTEILISGIDKQLVGETAAKIQKLRKADPYKGKGLHLEGAKIRRKQGKTGKK